MEQVESNKVLEEYKNFLRIVSHDLSAPIRHIEFFFNEIIESFGEHVDDESQNNIKFFRSSLETLNKKKKALLSMSRVVTHTQNCSQIQAGQLVKNALITLNNVIEEDLPKITYGDFPMVWADEDQLSLVFEILLENAILYNDNVGGKEVIISMDSDDSHYIFSIEDNGIGVEHKFHEPIFDIFRRLHGENEYGNGIGAGLTIAKSIIQRHGGEIYVDVAYKGGCKVIFTIPK